MNCTRVFEEVYAHLNKTWSNNSEKHVIGSLGQVVILLAPRTVPNDDELRSTILLIRQIKARHPDVRFLYYGSEFYSEPLKNLLLTEEDHLIRSLKIDDMNKYLLAVPRVLRPPINSSIVYGSRDQFEDYVGLQDSITYQLHPHWRNNTKKLEVTFHTVGYGAMRVCSWNEWAKVGTQDGFYCQELTGHNEISMTDYSDCTGGKPCPKTHYRIQNVTSMRRCAEMDCKRPNDVRYIVRMESLKYVSSTHNMITGSKFLTLFTYSIVLFELIFYS